MPASSASSSSSVQLPPMQLPMVSSPSCIAARLPTAAASCRWLVSTQAALQQAPAKHPDELTCTFKPPIQCQHNMSTK